MKRLFLLLFALALALPAAAQTITIGPGGASDGGGSDTTISLTLSNVPAHALAVVHLLWGDSSSTYGDVNLTSVTDGGDTFTCEAKHNDSAHDFAAELCYNLSVTGGASVTFTATWPSAPFSPEMVVTTATLSSGSWAFDAEHGAAATSSTAVNTGSVTTTGAVELMVFSAKLADAAATLSSPLIAGSAPTEFSWSPYSTYDHSYYRTTPASGAATATYSASTNWIAELSAFKAAGASTPCVPTLTVLGVGGKCG